MDHLPVRLMHYDPRWRQEFQQTRSSILHSCLGWVTEVEHIGSTAIDGLVARPTIDVAAGVDSEAALAPAMELIEGLNYGRDHSPDWAAEVIMMTKPRRLSAGQRQPTHRILLIKREGPIWR
ncbi:MAG: GrpB family protein, partial [Pirellulales bacterium]|nr:GrpB family protein [Pirellulales bacterium]